MRENRFPSLFLIALLLLSTATGAIALSAGGRGSSAPVADSAEWSTPQALAWPTLTFTPTRTPAPSPTLWYDIGFYDTPGEANDVAVAGGYAYVADGSGGLRIVDVSDLSAPWEVGFYDTPDTAYSVALAGGYAYVADRLGGLRIMDVSDPAAPWEVGFYDTPGEAYDVAVAGGYAYVAARESGLRIVDVSDPAAPWEVGFYDTPGSAHCQLSTYRTGQLQAR